MTLSLVGWDIGRDWVLTGSGSGKGWDTGREAVIKICNKEIEPIIVDPTPQKLAEHIPFVPVNLTSPFI